MSDPIRQRALQLQAEGPDEYPFDYYLYLAEEEADEFAEENK